MEIKAIRVKLKSILIAITDLLENSISINSRRSTIHAITNQDPNLQDVYYYNIRSTTILHEVLHYSTKLNEVDLAKRLGLKDSRGKAYTDRDQASKAISAALDVRASRRTALVVSGVGSNRHGILRHSGALSAGGIREHPARRFVCREKGKQSESGGASKPFIAKVCRWLH